MTVRQTYWNTAGILPPYVSADAILAQALPVLMPPEEITPSQAIAKYMVRSGESADLEKTPYMVEPVDMTVSRRYRSVVFIGPARAGKTFCLVDGQVVYRMICDPCSMQITQMDKLAASTYSQQKIDPVIRGTPELLDRLVARPGTLGNIHQKRFRGDGFLEIGWPVASHFASKDIQVTVATDRDAMPDNIEGEGDIYELMVKRGQNSGSRAMTIVESSPRRDIADENWSRSAIHELPPCPGIVALYNRGTRARYYWRCPHCRTEFEPSFALLRWPDTTDPVEAGQSTFMACQSCGGVIEPDAKWELNKSGRWLHETADGTRAVPIADVDVRPSDVVSYKLNGAHAAWQSWGQLVTGMLTLQAEQEITGSESGLKAFVNTSLGDPYLPKMRSASDLSPQWLADRAQWTERRQLPPDARFVTVQVDVQANRFVCQADAWCAGLERHLIDRWDIALPPSAAPGAFDADGKPLRAVAPDLYREDWAVLETLHELQFMDASGAWGLRPAGVIIDSQGKPGAYERALAFWKAQRRKGLDKVYHLYKGDGRLDQPRAKKRKPEPTGPKKRQQRNDAEIVFVCTNKIKDEVVASLTRREPGPLTYHLPNWLERGHFEEFCAERREERGWVKKAGHMRNESMDLAVFGKAMAIVLGAENIRDWDNPPAWAASGAGNAFAIRIGLDGAPLLDEGKRSRGNALADARGKFARKS